LRRRARDSFSNPTTSRSVCKTERGDDHDLEDIVMGDHAAAAPSAEPTFLTTAQAALVTGITVESLEQYRQLRKRGIVYGPDFVRFGRSVLYPREAVAAFIASRNGSR
jgi:hypothetical protein